MRNGLIVLWMLFFSIASSSAQVSVGIALPGVSIGVNLPAYPELVPVPGYPVYYAPQVDSNYFFYDGAYWTYVQDNWYASSWYNGPWARVAPEAVPLFVLRVPVRYYRQPPAYFRGWRSDAPPRWGEHWGSSWEERRRGWDNWNRRSAPPPAPLPVYQRQYSGDRYPHVEQQQTLQGQNYRYQPRDTAVQQHPTQRVQSAPAESSRGRYGMPPQNISAPPEQRGPNRQSSLPQRAAPTTALGAQPPRHRGEDVERPDRGAPQGGPTEQHQRQRPQQNANGQEQPVPSSQGQRNATQGRGSANDARHGQGKAHEKGEERGAERNK